ncbi:MAG: FecR family protein [Marinifilaceae bacterium]
MKIDNIHNIINELFAKKSDFSDNQLYADILNVAPEDIEVNSKKMWTVIETKVQHGTPIKRSIFSKTLRVAAVITPLLISSITLWYITQNKPQINNDIEKYDIVLTLGSGEQINLSGISDSIIGNTIHIEKDKSLTLTNREAQQEANELNRISVPRMTDYKITLSDGTKVWLNSESNFHFPATFGRNERRVYLEGEAYFEVTKNENCPFIVETDSMAIKVLGTSFNVKAFTNETINTTLLTGKVMCYSANFQDSLLLTPNEQAFLSQGKLAKKIVDADLAKSWQEGLFHFSAMPIKDIAKQLTRWYNVEFIFEEPALENYLFTGRLNKNYTINEVIAIVSSTTSLKFEQHNNYIKVYR